MKKIFLVITSMLWLLSACTASSKEVTLSFQEPNGNIAMIPFKEGDEVIELPIQTKAGHLFEGWYLDANHNQSVNLPFTINDSLVIYAKWIDIDTLAFNQGQIALKDLIDNTRGTINILSVDWICFFVYASDSQIPADKNIIDGIKGEVCAYFIEYQRDSNETFLYASLLISDVLIDSEFDEIEEFFDIERDLNISLAQLDSEYSEALRYLREINEETEEFNDEFIFVEKGLEIGTFTNLEIEEILRLIR